MDVLGLQDVEWDPNRAVPRRVHTLDYSFSAPLLYDIMLSWKHRVAILVALHNWQLWSSGQMDCGRVAYAILFWASCLYSLNSNQYKLGFLNQVSHLWNFYFGEDAVANIQRALLASSVPACSPWRGTPSTLYHSWIPLPSASTFRIECARLPCNSLLLFL